jgi:hypothetical protein
MVAEAEQKMKEKEKRKGKCTKVLAEDITDDEYDIEIIEIESEVSEVGFL